MSPSLPNGDRSDPSLAAIVECGLSDYEAGFADHIIALKAGKVVLNATSEDLMQPDALSRVYGLAMDVVTRPGRSPLASAL
ncbi:hypothetical protein FVA81_21200 [Rhizobium sp. WL3]|uniref:hypothetical protein n=1 Tax=Rhizobium sp. WL3 TaxID=2603277 RepID=UPI0011C1E554|nr:hypothetical protein [Rhizobium sp. WL3]QEE46969.1 hypothetical protein FVA81_21200 [Rhizobium sp. WL3]